MKILGSVLFVLGLVAILVGIIILAVMGAEGGEFSFDGTMEYLLHERLSSVRFMMLGGLFAVLTGAICKSIGKSKTKKSQQQQQLNQHHDNQN
jgi:predicted membrane protein